MIRTPLVFLLTAIVFSVATAARPESDTPALPPQVQAAKLCAAEAASVRDAYRALRDHLRARADTTRALVLLTQAEDALLKARSACRDDAEALRSFDALADDSEIIRRVLTPPLQ